MFATTTNDYLDHPLKIPTMHHTQLKQLQILVRRLLFIAFLLLITLKLIKVPRLSQLAAEIQYAYLSEDVSTSST